MGHPNVNTNPPVFLFLVSILLGHGVGDECISVATQKRTPTSSFSLLLRGLHKFLPLSPEMEGYRGCGTLTSFIPATPRRRDQARDGNVGLQRELIMVAVEVLSRSQIDTVQLA